MTAFPTVISAEHLGSIAGVTDAIVDRDIAETEREIKQYEHVQAAERELAQWHPGPNARKLAQFRADACTPEIQRRREFVDYLKAIKAARAVAGEQATEAVL